MNYFDIPLDSDIDFLLQETGKDIKINNQDARAIIQNTNKEKKDDKILITKFPVKQGMYVNYNNQWFLVISEIVDKKYDTYNKVVISKCEHIINFVIDNKLYGFPVCMTSSDLALKDFKIMMVRGDFLKLQMPKTPITKKIQDLQRVIKFGNAYEVWGKNEAQTDIITVTLLATSYNSSKDDMENEIGGRWIDGVDILDGNITPIMPFEETEIPEEKAVVTFFVLDRETEEFISDVIIKLEDSESNIIKMLNGESYEILKQTYTYTIEKEGYETQSDTIIVDKNINKVIFLDEAIEEPVGDDFTYTIEGADSIMWEQTKTYTVHKYNDGVEVDGVFTFELIGEVADIVGQTDNTVDIKARNNIYYEYATLKATDVETGEVVEKQILIKGLI